MVTAAIGTMAIPTEAAFLICLVWSILANSGSLWLRPPVPGLWETEPAAMRGSREAETPGPGCIGRLQGGHLHLV